MARSKYNARKVWCLEHHPYPAHDSEAEALLFARHNALEDTPIRFDSKREWERYVVLYDLQERGEIEDLERQPKFEVIPSFKIDGKTERATTYYADFQYYTVIDNERVFIIEDVKGIETPVFKLKRKLLLDKFLFKFQAGEWQFRIVK